MSLQREFPNVGNSGGLSGHESLSLDTSSSKTESWQPKMSKMMYQH